MAAAGCTETTVAELRAGYRMHVVAGDQQRAPAGSALATRLTVFVEDRSGSPAKGVRVRFTVTRGAAGGSRLEDAIGVTDPSGVASASLTLGGVADTTRVSAALAAVDGVEAEFTAIAVAPPVITAVAPAEFGPGDTVTISGSAFTPGATVVRIGEATATIVPGATAHTIRVVAPACLAAGPVAVRAFAGEAPSNVSAATYRAARAPLSLRPYEAITISASTLGDCIALAGPPGATYVVTAQFATAAREPTPLDWRLGADLLGGVAAAESAGGTSGAAQGATTVRAATYPDRTYAQRTLEAELRALERRIAPQARAQHAAGTAGAAFARVEDAPTVGSIRSFSVVAAVDGSRFETVTARLRHAGDHVLVYTDTASVGPGGAFSDERLVSLANLWDRDLYALATGAFGAEPDVDGNGRVIVLLTPAVNRLSKAPGCLQRGYVTGFFYGLDELEREPNGNKGEIFYALVPDSTGRHSCAHSEADVVRLLQGTFVHEMQHLISFNQHVLARGGDPEEPWLNEGLSHIAEEMAVRMYEARFPVPLGRSTKEQIFPDSAAPFIAPLLLNAYVYLNSTLAHSVTTYEGTGSLEERGASWLFLRWLGDQKGEATFRRLVEGPVTGIANVERVYGETFPALFGDFSLTLFTDSLPGVPRALVPPRLRFLGRSLRQLMAREAVVSGFSNPFPLTTYALNTEGALRSAMLQGTMVHAIVRSTASGAPLRLSFTTPALAPFAASLGAQVGIMRLPP